jgi:hypothetical protein
MTTDRERLQMLLMRLRELELRLPLPHERAILEVARQSLREQVSLLSHRMFDLGYTRSVHDGMPRVAC